MHTFNACVGEYSCQKYIPVSVTSTMDKYNIYMEIINRCRLLAPEDPNISKALQLVQLYLEKLIVAESCNVCVEDAADRAMKACTSCLLWIRRRRLINVLYEAHLLIEK